MYLIFDIGGSATKYALIDDDKIIKKDSMTKPLTMDKFIEFLEDTIDKFSRKYLIEGIGFASPGTVNTKTGEIVGESAIQYLNDYNFALHIKEKFKLPVAIENDANSAALCEMYYKKPKEDLIAFVIIGSGIGGAIIKDGILLRGRDLNAGEFGYMLLKNNDGEYENLSRLATLPNVAIKMKDKYHIKDNSYQILNKYYKDEEPYYSEVEKMFEYLCMGLYNIAYSINPDVIYIGGAISKDARFIKTLKDKLNSGIFKSAHINIRAVSFYNDNNLYGAYANLREMIDKNMTLNKKGEDDD